MNINRSFFWMLFVCLILSGSILAFLTKDVDQKTAEIKLGAVSKKIIIFNVIRKKEEPIKGFFYIPNTGEIYELNKEKINI